MEKTDISPAESKFQISEDWIVVVLAFLTIGLSLGGLVIPTPVYSWNDRTDLYTKVFTGKNLIGIGAQFLLVFVLSLFAGLLNRKSIKTAAIVLPTIYLLTVIALVMAGNKS